MHSLTKIIALCFLQVITFQTIGQTVDDEEWKLLELINHLRGDPQNFLDLVARPYIIRKEIDSIENKYVASLITVLKKRGVRPPLAHDKFLTRKARAFARDMGETGSVGHSSKKLGSFSTRLKRDKGNYTGENCSYGYVYALDILMQLLIDEDVPSLGHRKNILNRKFTRIGIAIEGHKRYDWNCVMDFGGS
jgi:uncharacterized protein YkwD